MIVGSVEEVVNDVYLIVVLIEWDEFKWIDFVSIFVSMNKLVFVFDGRNIFDC